MTQQPEPDLPAKVSIDEASKAITVAPLAARPQTNNWLSMPFVLTCFSWTLVAAICLINFGLAVLMASAGQYGMAAVNGLYSILMLWIFGSTLIGAPVLFMAVRQLEQRNFFVAEQSFKNYLDLVKRLRLYQDGHYQVATANLALIKLTRGDYHHAELLYEELIAKTKVNKRQAGHTLAAVYINNLACVKISQALTHEDLFDLELEEAERLANEALTIWRSGHGRKSPGGAAYPLLALAEIKILRHDLEAGEKLLQEVIQLNNSAKQSIFVLPSSRQDLYFESYLWLTLLYLKQGKKTEADAIIKSLISQLQVRPAPVLQHSMAVLNRIVRAYMEIGALTEAEEVLNFAYSVARGFPMHPEAQEIAETFEELLIKSDRKDEIADMKLWIRPVLELGLDSL